MTAITDPPRADFRLGMLWTDTRYRSLTIQVIALILVLLGASYLVSNVLANLAALGKDFSFGILTGPASYDINQRLIDYTSRSSHTTAAVVGMLNTLLIAVMGCALATIIGVVAGVLRLSNNWLISKLMTVYIETVRNIPVLIQILLLAAVFDEFLPSPRQAGPDAHVLGIVATNRGFYIPGPVFGAGSIFVVAALILGIVGSVWYARHAKRIQQDTGQLLPIWRVRLGLIIGLPFAVWLVIALVAGAPITLAYPELKGFNFDGGIYMRNSLVALWLALSIYTGAFIAETVRAGIMSVSKGQTEAAFALGLRANRTMSLVILPQALRVIIPPLISQYLNLTKNSSLAIAVGYMDATGTLGGITLNQTGREFETLLLLMAFYLSISLTISMIMNLYNEQVKLVERTSATGTAFSFGKLFDGMTGPWDTLKKGDAAHKPNFGVASWLNLVVLLYAGMLAAELAFLFLAEVPELRQAYFDWTLFQQLSFLVLLAFTLSTLLTAVFKHFRVVDLAVCTLAMWIVTLLAGNPLGLLIPALPSTLVVVGCAAAQLAAIAYLVFGARPNVTYFCRVRREG